MIEKQRQQDQTDDKQDGKQEGYNQQGGSSGIHKYFGKSIKPLKFWTSKVKKQFRTGQLQNLSVLMETNLNGSKDLQKAHEKTKLKFQYRWYSKFLQTKPKVKITLNPFLRSRLFQEVLLSWKGIISKLQEENFDIKFNDKQQLNLKYKRTKFFMQKKLRQRFESENMMDRQLNFKNSLSFQSLLKVPLFQTHRYLNSGQFKGKISLKDFSYQTKKFSSKLDFSQKLTFLINGYKAKQEIKVSLGYGQKQIAEVQSNIQITNDTNTWTIYGSATGYKWRAAFNEVKFLYSMYDNWKLGFMCSQKNTYQIILQNAKLNKPFCTSLALYLGNRNYAIICKNRFNKKQLGKINYELSLQNSLRNTRLDKISFGVNLNVNL